MPAEFIALTVILTLGGYVANFIVAVVELPVCRPLRYMVFAPMGLLLAALLTAAWRYSQAKEEA